MDIPEILSLGFCTAENNWQQRTKCDCLRRAVANHDFEPLAATLFEARKSFWGLNDDSTYQITPARQLRRRKEWIHSRLTRMPDSRDAVAIEICVGVHLCLNTFRRAFAIQTTDWKTIKPDKPKLLFPKRHKLRILFARVAKFMDAHPERASIAWNAIMDTPSNPCAELQDLSTVQLRNDYFKFYQLAKIPIVTHVLQKEGTPHRGKQQQAGKSLVDRLNGTVVKMDERLLELLRRTDPSNQNYRAVSNGGKNIKHSVRDGSTLMGHFLPVTSRRRPPKRLLDGTEKNEVLPCLQESFAHNLRAAMVSMMTEGTVSPEVPTLFSFLKSTFSLIQKPHRDFSRKILDQLSPYIGFFPVTTDGMFLQLWETGLPDGHIIFIPYGTLVILPGQTIHGGGFLSSPEESQRQNLRGHLYIYPTGSPEIDLQNVYKDEYDSNGEPFLDAFYRNDELLNKFGILFGCQE